MVVEQNLNRNKDTAKPVTKKYKDSKKKKKKNGRTTKREKKAEIK